MLKRKYCILGVLAALCFIGTGYYAWTLYNAHRKQVADWNEEAKVAFEEALWMEVDKRAEVPFYHFSSEEHGVTTLKAKIPDSVFVTSPLGRRGYRIERYKYDNSLIKETRKRAGLSSLFAEYPLSIDTLIIHWDSLLYLKQIPIRGKVRYVYTDLELQNDTIYSVVSKQSLRLDSLTVKYLGFRCEHEVVAYVFCPYWMNIITGINWCILLLPWILLILLFVCYPQLNSLLERKLMYETVIEKEIHIADVQINKAVVFKLPDGTLFDSFTKILSKGDIQHSLQPQSVSLLKLFLCKSDLKVASEEISWELWQEKREKDRLYSAIRRLRNDLKIVKSDLVISCTDGVYELKSPISSKKSD